MSGGLGNIGNTCYINTTLQCLGFCEDFLNFILKKKNETNNLAAETYELFKELWINKHTIAPRKFLKYLKDNINMIEIYEQNDINEFMAIFIDKLNTSLAKNISITRDDLTKNNNYTSSDFDLQRLKMDLSWYEKTGKEYSQIVPMFHGQSISQIICGNCDKIFHNYEIYFNLMLPVNETSKTIYDCFDDFFKEEYINTDSLDWTCDSCSHKHKSKKTMKLWRNPSILIISLKRFIFAQNSFKKNNKPIEVPEKLDISKYCIPNNKVKYKLVSIAHHSGSYNSGHYHAICNHENKWYEYDDMSVKSISNPNHTNGYVYFYVLDNS
jgi:ubiquitin C-terminal hydrolase